MPIFKHNQPKIMKVILNFLHVKVMILILNNNYLILNFSLLGTLVYNKKKLTDYLLTISETFT